VLLPVQSIARLKVQLSKEKNMEALQGDRPADAVPVSFAKTPEMSSLPVWDALQLRLAITAAGVALWSWNVDTNRFTMDQTAFRLCGVQLSESVTFDDLSSHIHPADRDRVKAAFAATRAIIGAYEIDFRIMVGEEVRWVSARGQGNDADIVGRIMYSIFLDVTGRKQAEEGHELLAGEMSHRVKNLLAIAAGLTAITSRSAKTTADMAKELTHRLAALGRTHDLVRPLPGHGGKAALLGDLLTVLLAPYDDMGAFSGRVRVYPPDARRRASGDNACARRARTRHQFAEVRRPVVANRRAGYLLHRPRHRGGRCLDRTRRASGRGPLR
jgi:two-component sensor histidine kinase